MMNKPVVLHYLCRDDFGGGPKNVDITIGHYLPLATQHVTLAREAKLTQLLSSRPDVSIHRLPDLPLYLFPVIVLNLLIVLWKVRPDAIITHGQWSGAIMGMALPFAPRCATAYVVHWCALYHMTSPIRATRNFTLEWLAVRTHQQVVCVSEGNLQQYFYAKLLKDRAKVSVIPNPVVPVAKPKTTTIDSKLTFPPRIEGITTFLFLGRLDDQKRPDWLLTGWKNALDGGLQNARLLILGDGSMRVELENYTSRANMNSTVFFLGYCSNTESYLRDCDVVLMTSMFEGHANVPLEAMAHGKPIIATAADGIRESFTDKQEGYLVHLGDCAALAKRILELAHDSSKRQMMGAKGLERTKQFSMDANRIAYQKMLEGILHLQATQ